MNLMTIPAIATPASPAPASSGAGIVVIGRNEGERLIACLQALVRQHRPILYVDSGSSDGSVERARALDVEVLELDPSRPFSAARARNEGAAALFRRHADLRFVQFIDGDCIPAAGWLDAAETALDADERRAVVFGQLEERDPGASIYNRLCALEWRSPAGRVTNFGHILGITMVRRSVFESLGGFNSAFVAGEDPEFGARVSMAGYHAHKLAVPMAVHDADIKHFGQWWTRAVRGGHAIGQRARAHAKSDQPDGAHELRSTLFWAALVPALIVLALPATHGGSLLLLGGYAVLAWRIARYRRRIGDSAREAWLCAVFTVVGKFANAWGLLKYHLNRLRGRIRIIEYK